MAQTHDLSRMATEEIVNLGMAMVPEGRRLFPRLTVEENLLLGAFRPRRAPASQRTCEFCYEMFPILQRAQAPTRRVAVRRPAADARDRACAHERRRTCCWSTSLRSGLSPILVSHTISKIRELKERYGLTVLMAEQNFHQAIRIADRGYIIVHGEIVFEGSVAELEQNDLVKRYYLGT